VAVYTSGPRLPVRVPVPLKAGSPVAESFGKERYPFHFSLRIVTLHTREDFFGYKAKTGIPYTLIYLHEASGFYGPKTLEIRGKR